MGGLLQTRRYASPWLSIIPYALRACGLSVPFEEIHFFACLQSVYLYSPMALHEMKQQHDREQ